MFMVFLSIRLRSTLLSWVISMKLSLTWYSKRISYTGRQFQKVLPKISAISVQRSTNSWKTRQNSLKNYSLPTLKLLLHHICTNFQSSQPLTKMARSTSNGQLNMKWILFSKDKCIDYVNLRFGITMNTTSWLECGLPSRTVWNHQFLEQQGIRVAQLRYT